MKYLIKGTGILYIKKAKEHGWSRNVLSIQIETNLYQREGKAVTTFDTKLPKRLTLSLAKATLQTPIFLIF